MICYINLKLSEKLWSEEKKADTLLTEADYNTIDFDAADER